MEMLNFLMLTVNTIATVILGIAGLKLTFGSIKVKDIDDDESEQGEVVQDS